MSKKLKVEKSLKAFEKSMKSIKKSMKKFLHDIEKANEKEFGKSGQLDCCKLNKSHKKK